MFNDKNKFSMVCDERNIPIMLKVAKELNIAMERKGNIVYSSNIPKEGLDKFWLYVESDDEYWHISSDENYKHFRVQAKDDSEIYEKIVKKLVKFMWCDSNLPMNYFDTAWKHYGELHGNSWDGYEGEEWVECYQAGESVRYASRYMFNLMSDHYHDVMSVC